MPISITEYALPKWTRLRERYTIAGIENKRDIFMNFSLYPRSYRNGVYPMEGYNPAHDSTTIERVRLDTEDMTLKGH